MNFFENNPTAKKGKKAKLPNGYYKGLKPLRGREGLLKEKPEVLEGSKVSKAGRTPGDSKKTILTRNKKSTTSESSKSKSSSSKKSLNLVLKKDLNHPRLLIQHQIRLNHLKFRDPVVLQFLTKRKKKNISSSSSFVDSSVSSKSTRSSIVTRSSKKKKKKLEVHPKKTNLTKLNLIQAVKKKVLNLR